MKAGDEIPVWELPITPTLVVSTAIATRDFQDVHHDRDRAQAAGSKDIFMNILTSTALCERYVTDWAGPDVQIKGIAIRLGAPAYPYDTLSFSGEVSDVTDGIATIDVRGEVSLGAHVTGTVKVSTGSTTGDRASTTGDRASTTGYRASTTGGAR
ncbi:MAG: MaoC family dehydratase [Nocardioides sp.]|uniref:MaoC family dehydratase n=1 Tax=Nocardioides sp. TaxID=35761 RepID=UPI003D6B4832